MNKTPLLTKLRDSGATLYVFPSASEDIGLNLNSRATGVAMSHYALLNLPKLIDISEADLSATGKYPTISAAEALSQAIALELQNYVMNFETLLLNQDSYNYLEYHTVTERVFWHWLKSRMKKLELNSELTDSNDKTYSSDTYSTETFSVKKVVQCFGSIDAGNSLSTEFGMFNETYVNIPTSYGNGPVFFKSVLDSYESNYVSGQLYIPTNTNVLQGRELSESGMHLLTNTPFYDADNYYYDSECLEIVKNINEIQTAILTFTGNKDILITSYDDVNIDNKELFKDTLFDITTDRNEFGFNAILLYYSVYDQDDTTKTPYAINLFGIIFLDSPAPTMIIPTLLKKKSYAGNTNSAGFFGNSYSFRVNIKTMSVYDNTDAIIQDNTTMSSINSVDFSDVISNLNRAIDVMNTNVLSTMAIQDQYMSILKYYDDFSTRLDDISTKVNSYLSGAKQNSLVTNKLLANKVYPEDTETNLILISFARRKSDYLDTAYYQGSDYVPPIIITNDYNTFNVPTVFKPIFDEASEADTAMGTWYDTIGDVENIIENTSIKYYKYQDMVYPSIDLPESVIAGFNLTNQLYRKGSDLDSTDDTISNVTFVNYEALTALLIQYVKKLKEEIDTLKNT